jgi:peptide/nickel transport system substrate-binding protein
MQIAHVTRIAWISLLMLVMSCASPAPGPSSSRPSAASTVNTPKRFTAAISGDPNTLSYSVSRAGSGGVPGLDALEMFVSSGLTIEDDRGARRPQLAEAVPTLENGGWRLLPDGRMETTWTIRPNARWHDGTPVTAHDLVFTLLVGQDQDIPALSNAGYASIESAEATETQPDARTVLVRWHRPFIFADGMFSFDFGLPLPRHLLEHAYHEDKANFLQAPYWTTEFVGSGPYRVRQWVQGSHMILGANDGYVLGRPKLDEIEVRFIPDANALFANILAGEVGLTMGRGLSLEQAIQLRDQWRDGSLGIVLSSWIAAYPQMLNPNPPVVADARFRRALLHAVDRQQMVEALQAGQSLVAHSYLSPKEPEYRDIEGSIVRYDYEPRRASELIEGLGYARGTDGSFRDSTGQPLTVELRTTGGDDLQEKTMFSIADYWQRAGITVEPVVIPRQRAQDREYRANFPGFEEVRQPNDLTTGALTRFIGPEAATAENNYRGNNRMRYRSAELDALVDRFYQTVPKNERAQILGGIMHHMTDQVIPAGMFYNAAPTMISKRLVNVGSGGSRVPPSWNVQEWDMK